MKLKDYISYKKLPIAVCVFALTVIGFVLFASGVKTDTLCFVLCFSAVLFVLCLAAGFISGKRRVDFIERSIAQLDKKYLLGEILPKPGSELERAYYSAMRVMSYSVVEEAERAKREKQEYREYVEAWIHEIKTPLTACSLILENGGDRAKLRRELKRADNMTETILYYARLSEPEKDRLIRTFDVSDIIEAEIKNQMPLLIACKASVETSGSFMVSSDDKALSFIISQLLINSAKYCSGCHINISAQAGVITYEDDGIGIPSHELQRVTERGFTGTNGRNLGNSTGMGLYIVASLCRESGITLKIESEQQKYTRFILEFDSLTKV
ncbi:MAG: HAMP domain-containing histidine kinase [Clostridiales bacterium]|nr:HAMP domain-containing histidine kinase [Clostridiales bacterium]